MSDNSLHERLLGELRARLQPTDDDDFKMKLRHDKIFKQKILDIASLDRPLTPLERAYIVIFDSTMAPLHRYETESTIYIANERVSGATTKGAK